MASADRADNDVLLLVTLVLKTVSVHVSFGS